MYEKNVACWWVLRYICVNVLFEPNYIVSINLLTFQANIVTEEMVIPPKFYNSLIGAGGKLIHTIMEECGGVAIKFPQAESRSDKVS